MLLKQKTDFDLKNVLNDKKPDLLLLQSCTEVKFGTFPIEGEVQFDTKRTIHRFDVTENFNDYPIGSWLNLMSVF